MLALGLLAIFLILRSGNSEGNNIHFDGKKGNEKVEQVMQKTEQGGIHFLKGQLPVNTKYILIMGALVIAIILIKWEFHYKSIQGLCRCNKDATNMDIEMAT